MCLAPLRPCAVYAAHGSSSGHPEIDQMLMSIECQRWARGSVTRRAGCFRAGVAAARHRCAGAPCKRPMSSCGRLPADKTSPVCEGCCEPCATCPSGARRTRAVAQSHSRTVAQLHSAVGCTALSACVPFWKSCSFGRFSTETKRFSTHMPLRFYHIAMELQ
ncbi:uncharacterized protein LOC112050953 isoform X2 [Bicyclus anynana]|uniref:Uncharacterized protein LOC112050953 isoform X2 n=1 Tax=Bicyclus anynana TaxID=110368 RepID=A0A6J1NBK0_BICAN|nr:uncharacterized protein LOC112050953 isoform X2 [Bicyclus anynana]